MFFGRSQPLEIKKRYKKWFFGSIERGVDEARLGRNGYVVFSEQDVKQYSGAKGLFLGLIFLPLALLGGSRYVEVTYRLKKSL